MRLMRMGKRCKIKWKDTGKEEYFGSIKELCERFEVSQVTGWKWLNGKYIIPLPFEIEYVTDEKQLFNANKLNK